MTSEAAQLDREKFKGHYETTADGRVFSLTSNWRGYGRRELKPSLHNDGYLVVRLTVPGEKRLRVKVHHMVALEHLPPKPSPLHEIRHLDGNPLNNAASNLAWGTRAENAADRAAHGRTSSGAKHSAAIKVGLVGVTMPSPKGRKLQLTAEDMARRVERCAHMRALRKEKLGY